MYVAGEIQIVDLRPLKSGRLLCAHVRCKDEQAVLSVLGWQVRSTSVQLVDDDGDVLVSEVSFLFDQVSNGSAGCPPGDNAVEAGQGLRTSGTHSGRCRPAGWPSRASHVAPRVEHETGRRPC